MTNKSSIATRKLKLCKSWNLDRYVYFVEPALYLKVIRDFFCAMKTSHNVGFFPLSAISCGHPGVPANAILSGDKFTYGSIIHYSCTAGRRLIGNSTRECQEDSHWSGTLPHCSGMWASHYLNVTLSYEQGCSHICLANFFCLFSNYIFISPIPTPLYPSYFLKYSHNHLILFVVTSQLHFSATCYSG